MITDSLFLQNGARVQCGNSEYFITRDTLGTFNLTDNSDSIVASTKIGATRIHSFIVTNDTFYFGCQQTLNSSYMYGDTSRLFIKKYLLKNGTLTPLDSIFIQPTITSYRNTLDAKLAITDNSIVFLYKLDNSLTATFINKTNYSLRNVHTGTCGRTIKVVSNNLYTAIGNHIDIYSLSTPNSLLISDQWIFQDSITDFCFNPTLDTIPLLTSNGLVLYKINSGTPTKASIYYPLIVSYSNYMNYFNGNICTSSYSFMNIYNIPTQQNTPSSIYSGDYIIYGNSVYCHLFNSSNSKYEGKILRWRDSSATSSVDAYRKSILNNPLHFYPNPFNDIINISNIDMSSKMNVSIFNSIGQRIFQSKENCSKISWNARNLPNGIYIAKILIGTQLISKKLILTN
jgi:hypothetical protein